MKELSIEGKAYNGNYKAYTELINRLEDVKKSIKKQNYGIAMDILCHPYPDFQVITNSEIEKQDEQKPVDKAEQKFHEGEWVFIEEVKGYKNGPFQIKTVDSFGYSFDEYHTIPFMYEELLSKWTIQDAKDGDVLAVNNEVFIYAHRKQMYSIAVAHCFVDSAGGFYLDGEFGYTEKGNSIHPATKEQRDTLMKAMADAGYTFNFEKKELKKIEQKPAWSEEDEERLSDAIFFVREYQIPTRDKRLFNAAKKTEDWLRTFKDKVQPKQEWSDEDETMIDTIIFDLERHGGCGKDCSYQKEVNWLKSLRLQKQWKPSKEQLEQLGAIVKQNKDNMIGKELMTLCQDLKKLREE